MGVLEFFNAEQNFEKFDEVPEHSHFEKNDKSLQQKGTVKSFYRFSARKFKARGIRCC